MMRRCLITIVIVSVSILAIASESPSPLVRPYPGTDAPRRDPVELEATSADSSICPGALGRYHMTVVNNTGQTTSFDILYTGFDWNVSGESTVGPLGDGETAEFRVDHRPPDSAAVGQIDLVTVTALDQGSPNSASVDLTTSIAQFVVTAGPHAPDTRMDHAVIAESRVHSQDLIWAIGGYDASYPTLDSPHRPIALTGLLEGATVSPEATVNRFFPRDLVWSESTADEFPIPFPGDHAVGYNVSGEAIVAAFPDATGFSDSLLHIFNLERPSRAWTRAPLPAGFPPDGIWAHDISCNRSADVCYLTGGALAPGGGDLTSVYAYSIRTNTISPLPPFASPRAHHASFLLDDLLCIAGGIDATDTALDSTQCYDIVAGSWRPENADLGPLPGTLWGMADAVMEIDGDLRPVMAAGIYNGGPPGTHFLWHDGVSWQYDSPFEVGVYRTEADVIGGDLFLVGGSTGGITPSNLLQTLHWCPTEIPIYADCVGAIEVPFYECVRLTNHLVGDSGPPPPSCGSYRGGDLWIRFTATGADYVDVDVKFPSNSASTGPGIALYAECPHEIELDCSDGSFGHASFPALSIAGTHWVRIWERGNDAFGEFEICVEGWIPVELLNISVE